jgi:integrase
VSTITKKPTGKYYARWRDPSGAQKAKTFDRKLDAERFLASVTIDTATGRYVDPRAGRVTVADYVAGWVDGQPWRESTRASREAVIDAQILPTFGRLPIASVRTSDVQAWVGRMSTDGLAPSTVETYFRVFAQIMLSARHDKVIAESPCDGARLPRRARGYSVGRVLSVDEVAILADEVPDRYRALVVVSASLGLRQGEACGLTVDRINFLRRTVTIDRQVVTRGRAVDAGFGPPKTPSSVRTIPLPSTVADIFAAHLASFGEGPDRLVFTTSDGAMISRQTWHGAFSAAAKRTGIEASSHDLRHHAASLLISAACSPRAVASFLGHKNATETLNTYAHLWPSDEGRIVAAIDDVLRGSVREVCADGVSAGS